MKLFRPDFFLFMAAISLSASIGLALKGEDVQSSIASVCMLMCIGFYSVLRKLNDTNKK